jgi:hypothetical protein
MIINFSELATAYHYQNLPQKAMASVPTESGASGKSAFFVGREEGNPVPISWD